MDSNKHLDLDYYSQSAAFEIGKKHQDLKLLVHGLGDTEANALEQWQGGGA